MDGATSIELTSPFQEENPATENVDMTTGMIYSIDDNPPWYLSIALGFQHYLTMFGASLSIPFILAPQLCIQEDDAARGYLMSTLIFVSGIITLLQSTFGVRLPIIQGGTFAFLVPTIAILNLDKWKCPDSDQIKAMNLTSEEIWQPRMREIQGAIIVASLFEVVIGITGIMGLVLRFVTPLTIAPTVALIGLALFTVAAEKAGDHWGISALTFALIALFSQYLRNVKFPLPSYTKMKGFRLVWKPVFQLFPVLISIMSVWIFCCILTVGGALDKNSKIRTDNIEIVHKSPWFRIPYPGQWGMPTVSTAAVFGMLPGVIAGMIESIGDYYACAKLSNAPPPPVHAINRGIFVEGIGCVLAGFWGSGTGTTSFSENIGAIGVTKVASRRVIQWAAIILIILGVFGKFGGLFVTIPGPLVGGVFCGMFGMIAAVGLSSLQYVDLNSPRNLFVLGSSLLLGLGIPHWMNSNKDSILIPGKLKHVNAILRIVT
ncbi:SLC23A2 (predicted) [Pycnogonum litorale]